MAKVRNMAKVKAVWQSLVNMVQLTRHGTDSQSWHSQPKHSQGTYLYQQEARYYDIIKKYFIPNIY